MRYGAFEDDWFAVDVLQGWTEDLLPVVSHPTARVSRQSKLKSLGKTPSLYTSAREVVGMLGWTQHRTSAPEVEAWSREPDYGICVQTRHIRALDIDVADAARSDAIVAHLRGLLGPLPSRFRLDSGKQLLYFTTPGDFGKRILPVEGGVVELLATGQQFILAGTHPDGERYMTSQPLDAPLPALSLPELNAAWASLEQTFGSAPGVATRHSTRNTQLANTLRDDRVAAYLDAHGWVRAPEQDGRLHIRCPWAHEHTTPDIESATTYFPPHTHGYAQGHFRCLHAHCATRTDAAFLDAVGFTDVAFDPVPENEAPARSGVDLHIERIDDAASDLELRERVCLGVQADTTLTEIDREHLAQILRGRLAALGKPLTLRLCRTLVKPQKRFDTAHLPDWLQGWTYVKDRDRFFRLDSPEWATPAGFNAQYAKTVAGEGAADGGSPSALALSVYGIPVVQRRVYLPWAEPLFTLDGATCANQFRPSSVPDASQILTPEDEEAIRVMDDHLRRICGGRESVHTALLSWIAHNVQHPGLKIRHAPLIRGVPGDGKSTIGQLLSAVLGPENTRDIGPSELKSSFNGFSEGFCVAVFEEIRVEERNSTDITDLIKPWITNDRIPVHRKGVDGYNVYNTVNYLAFTNHADAIPLTDMDRRWFVIFSPYHSIHDLAVEVGDTGAYFDTLYHALHHHPGALRRWLLDYPIARTFNRNGAAPITEERASMVALTASEGVDTILSILEHGAPGVGRHVVSSRHLTDAIRARGEVPPRTRGLATRLLEAGFVRVNGRPRWQGEQCIVWKRHSVEITTDGIQRALDATLG